MTVFAVSSSCKGLQNSGIVSEVKIRDIQGRAHRSPLEGKGVKGVKGVVTAISNDKYSRGFYMQDTNPDNDDSTSEGIFVEAKKDKLNVKEGDLVEVDGTVIEAKNEIKGMGGLTTTEIKAVDIKTKSHNNKLPDPIIIGASGRRPSTTTIDSDGLKVFNPDKDAIDFYESLEGMLVKVDKPLVVGLDERYGEVYVLPDNGIASQSKKTIFNGINISKNNFNPEKLTIDDVLVPITDNHTKKFIDKRFDNLKTGDKFNDSITGVMTYAFGNYKILRSEEHTSELQSRQYLVCRLLLEKKKYYLSFFRSSFLPPSLRPLLFSSCCLSHLLKISRPLHPNSLRPLVFSPFPLLYRFHARTS